MNRDETLKKLYESVTELPSAKRIRESEKGLFEKLLHNEASYIAESTFSGDLAQLGQILIPVYRRAFPMLIGKDIVGVQPMSQPTGYAFALRYHFVGNKAGNGSNRVLGGGNSGNSTYATNYQITPSDTQRTSANSLLLVWSSTVNRQADAPDVGYGDAPVNGIGDLAGLCTIIYSELNKAVVRISDSGVTLSDIKALADQSGTEITDWYDNEAGYLNILKSYPGPLSTLVGEQLTTDMQEMALTIDKIGVQAQTRKLKARYTLESAQDLKAIHGKDMAAELVDILTFEIVQSIDRDIIDTINSQAVASTYDVSTEADGRWSLEKYRSVYTELIRKSNDIAKTTLRGPGNFVVAAPDVITMVEQIPTFTGIAPMKGDVDTNAPVNSLGQSLVGSVGGRFNVYRDIFAATNYATIGYKGPSSYDSGVIWLPYVPLQMKEVIDPENANPSIIFIERSAITSNIFASDLYYRKVTFSNIFTKTA